MAIRFNKKLNDEINKAIKNFNQKIDRLSKRDYELLPERITKKELKEEYKTRTELRRKLNELRRFSKRGAEDVVETSGGLRLLQYDIENIKRERARVKRNVTREIKRLETEKPKIFGKEQSSTFSQMGDTEYLNLKTKQKALSKDIQSLNKEEFKRFKKLVERTGRNQTYMKEQFKENYFEMLGDLAYYFNYDKAKMNELKQKLMKLNENDFLKLFKTDKSIKAILDYYPTIKDRSKGKTSFLINPDDIKEDVTSLYDNLYENIDEILKDYA